MGAGERMLRERMVHEGLYLKFKGELHRLNFQDLVGKSVMIYAQQELVKDLVALRLGYGAPIHFEVGDVTIADLDGPRPKIRFTEMGAPREIECDYIAGCDGFHGICRPSVPDGKITVFDRDYPFAWLGILAEAPPTKDELVYTHHERGFALLTMRTPTLSRLYLQVEKTEDIANWPDERIWDELRTADIRRRGMETLRRADRPKRHHRHAQLRGRADAVWAALPRRRRRAYRAADRRQGHEPRHRRRPRARPRALKRSINPAAPTCWRITRAPACAGCGRCSASRGG